jgi:hypothetical protein
MNSFHRWISEYSHSSDIDENVAVIVCGHTTRFQRYYSNKYSDIIHCVGMYVSLLIKDNI